MMPEYEERYRSLLRTEWSTDTLPRALALLDELASPAYTSKDDQQLLVGHEPSAAWNERWSSWRTFFDAIIDPLNPSLPDLPQQLPVRAAAEQVEAAFLAMRTLVLLLFPRLPCQRRPDEPLSRGAQGPLFRDVQSVAFQTCLLFLMPDLERLGLAEERALLINALNAHALLFWQHDPAQQQLLLGMLHDTCGQTEASLAALRTSFARTQSDDHDYLTKAQLYWSRLRDAGQIRGAEEFVLWLYRNAPQEHLAEIKRLIQETFHGALAA